MTYYLSVSSVSISKLNFQPLDVKRFSLWLSIFGSFVCILLRLAELMNFVIFTLDYLFLYTHWAFFCVCFVLLFNSTGFYLIGTRRVKLEFNLAHSRHCMLKASSKHQAIQHHPNRMSSKRTISALWLRHSQMQNRPHRHCLRVQTVRAVFELTKTMIQAIKSKRMAKWPSRITRMVNAIWIIQKMQTVSHCWMPPKTHKLCRNAQIAMAASTTTWTTQKLTATMKMIHWLQTVISKQNAIQSAVDCHFLALKIQINRVNTLKIIIDERKKN